MWVFYLKRLENHPIGENKEQKPKIFDDADAKKSTLEGIIRGSSRQWIAWTASNYGWEAAFQWTSNP